MRFQIPDLLSPDELHHISAALAGAEFVDGKLTAGWNAKLVKHNEQIDQEDASELNATIARALLRNPVFDAGARPRAIHSILFSRYRAGMSYGRHTDDAFMGRSGGNRADLSFTLFLSHPDDYDGGELVIEESNDEHRFKLPSNTLLVYPSSSLHRVTEVTHGQRLVAVGWVHSLIRDAAQREILFDLDAARRALFAKSGKTEEFDLLSKSLANLIRRWAD